MKYYNQFAEKNRESIVTCPEPEYWTTDYSEKGRVYKEMKERVDLQKNWINKYFDSTKPVLDIGCGFGRQAFWMAKNGYELTGIDTSDQFISIAKELFSKNGLKAKFVCTDVSNLKTEKFAQVVILDVLEHFPPGKRRNLIDAIAERMTKGGTLFISLPRIKDRLSSRLNNLRKNFTGLYSAGEEHPYPIPGKKKMLELTRSFFTLKEFDQSDETVFYIFQRK